MTFLFLLRCHGISLGGLFGVRPLAALGDSILFEFYDAVIVFENRLVWWSNHWFIITNCGLSASRTGPSDSFSGLHDLSWRDHRIVKEFYLPAAARIGTHIKSASAMTPSVVYYSLVDYRPVWLVRLKNFLKQWAWWLPQYIPMRPPHCQRMSQCWRRRGLVGILNRRPQWCYLSWYQFSCWLLASLAQIQMFCYQHGAQDDKQRRHLTKGNNLARLRLPLVSMI